MAKFTIDKIFPITGRPQPYLVGRLAGDLMVGDTAVLEKPDGRRFPGTIDAIDICASTRARMSLCFSPTISAHAEPGDTIHVTPRLAAPNEPPARH